MSLKVFHKVLCLQTTLKLISLPYMPEILTQKKEIWICSLNKVGLLNEALFFGS